MTASYGLALGGAFSRAEQRDQQAAFAEAVIPLVGDSGRAESPPRPTSFTGDRRVG
jgi:hypothetical protein